MIDAVVGKTFVAVLDGAPTGIAGTLGLTIRNPDGSVDTPRSTVGITEIAATGTYVQPNVLAPDTPGTYLLVWDTGGASPMYATEELDVAATLAGPFIPKEWLDNESGGTPLDAEGLNDLEARIAAGIQSGSQTARGDAEAYADAIAAGGIELGYSQITANATRAATSYADVAGLTVTVTVGTRPIVVRFSAGALGNDTANGGASLAILEDGNVIGSLGSSQLAANGAIMANRHIRRAPAAGSHTYKVQMKTAFSGTATLYADSAATYGPAFIQVLEI